MTRVAAGRVGSGAPVRATVAGSRVLPNCCHAATSQDATRRAVPEALAQSPSAVHAASAAANPMPEREIVDA